MHYLKSVWKCSLVEYSYLYDVHHVMVLVLVIVYCK